MKKSIFSAVALMTAISAPAFADVNAFEGYNAGLNLKMINTSSSTTIDGVTIDIGKDTLMTDIQGGYVFRMTPRATLGVSVDYSFGEVKGGNIGSAELKGKNAWGVALEPGYVMSKDTLIYGILSFNRIQGEAVGEGESASKSFYGVGYGAGTRIKLDSNWYVQLEAKSIHYEDKSIDGVNFKPRATLGLIGVGYRF